MGIILIKRSNQVKGSIIIIFLVLLTGCSTKDIVLNYSPSSTMTVKGALDVGRFEYLPAKNNDIKPNQIKNSALGNVLFEKNIHEYFEAALFTEARFVGIEVNNSNASVSGEIREFFIDDLGFSVDWTLEVTYLVKKNGQRSNCYHKTKKIEKNTEKFANVFGTLNEIIKLNIEEAFKDMEFTECIRLAS
ncbi:MAG: hypothetical protein NPINA01_14990 [Nitrospinaceae bacterium]|nr:MAG: hypothetical protein NPINA01_14990 [Nitrospinaceae bacterium]